MSQMTKKALAASLKKLLQKKTLNQITINDITDDCGVNRMTFYYHFSDIYDLIEWIFVEDAAKFLAGKTMKADWKEGFLNVFNTVLESRSLIMNVYRSISREQLENYLYKVTCDLLMGAIEEESEGVALRDADKQFIADFYKYAFVGIMLDWIKNDMKEDPQKIIERLDTLLSGNIARAVQAFRADSFHQKNEND